MLPKWVSSCPCTRGSGGLAQGQGEDVPGSQGWAVNDDRRGQVLYSVAS